jgi:MFS transporter, Spinster family, sphingosine-1-phosphate transporter
LLMMRGLMGISEAFYIPAALALIADFHTPRTRSRAVGIHQMALYAGLIIGGMSGYAADSPDIGWRGAFTIAGVAGVLYSFPLVFLLRDAPQQAGSTLNRPSPSRAAWELFTNFSYWMLVLYFTLPAIAGWVVKDWMPAVLKDRFLLDQGSAGLNATLYVNLASLGGAFLGGWLADHWLRRTLRARVYVSAIGVGLIVPALLGIGYSPTLVAAVSFLCVFGIGWGFFDANNMPILSQIVRPELRATGYGIMNLLSISCGGFTDWAFGYYRDKKAGDELLFGVVAVVCIVSIALVLMIRPRRDLK